MTTREELIAKYRAEAEAEAGRPLDADEFETGSIYGASDNPFVGEVDAEEKYLKMQLSLAIKRELRLRGLKQRELAARAGLTQSDISQITRGKLKGFSEARMIEVLAALGNDVEIRYRHRADNGIGKVSLVAG